MRGEIIGGLFSDDQCKASDEAAAAFDETSQ